MPLEDGAESRIYSAGYALIIGAGGDLSETIDDADAIYDLLIDSDRCAYPKDQVIKLTGEAAQRKDILKAFESLKENLAAGKAAGQDGQTVVIYFSGHGIKKPSYYFLPNAYNTQNLDETCISGADFSNHISSLEAERVIVLLDMCYAGGQVQLKAASEDIVQTLSTGQGRYVIASSRSDQTSRILGQDKYSVFTLALMLAFQGQGANKKDGFVYIGDLVTFASSYVYYRTNGEQSPSFDFKDADNIAIAYYAGGKEKVPDLGTILIPTGSVATENRLGWLKHSGPLSSIHRNELRKILVELFNKIELRTLCIDLDIKPDEIRQDTLTQFSDELVLYAERHQKVPALIDQVYVHRPFLVEVSQLKPQQKASIEKKVQSQEDLKNLDTDRLSFYIPQDNQIYPNDQFYIERANVDDVFQTQYKMGGTITTLRGPRKYGITPLLLRGSRNAKESGATVYTVNFELGNRQWMDAKDGETFYYTLAFQIAAGLGFDYAEIDTFWQKLPIGHQIKFKFFLRDFILNKIDTYLLLIFDHCDIVLRTQFYNDFFASVRDWHNEAAASTVNAWQKLSVILVIAFDPNFMINNPNQSPFNVGRVIEVRNFNAHEIGQMSRKMGAPLSADDITDLHHFTGGHPHLVRCLLATIKVSGLNWATYKEGLKTGLFSYEWQDLPLEKYVEGLWANIKGDESLKRALKEVANGKPPTDPGNEQRLIRSGIVKKRDVGTVFQSELFKYFFTAKVSGT